MQWLTASIGMAGVTGTDMRLSDLLERADRALYQAKHQGRNRIILG
jgi:diguanylate cyclase (GGDEF)-like protein